MKLKQRVVILSTIITTFSLCLMGVTYYYTQSYHNDVVVEPLDLVSRMKMKLMVQDQLRSSRRKLAKKVAITPNSSVYDSNRAVEVEMIDKEYEDFLEKKEPLTKNLEKSILVHPNVVEKDDTAHRRETSPECLEEALGRDTGKKREKFPDLLQFVQNNGMSPDSKKLRVTLQEIHGIKDTNNLSHLDLFHIGVSDLDLYAEDDPNVEALLRNMATLPIVHVEEKPGGTQLKLIITYQDGSQALFKPMRFDREKETLPNHFYFVDYERHTSEIAAFHIDRILGFRRCPPVVGRRFNITTEIYALAEDDLIRTFFISPARNICFHGTCSYYCDTAHAICGRPDTVEASLAAFLPPDTLSGRKSWKSPWRRSYHKRRKANFEKNPKHCDVVRKQPLYKDSKRLADLVDASILDFLIGNMDRHHYETFKIFGNDSFIVHLDHGRGFGRPSNDEITILAPLSQCCFISFTTFQRLLELQHGPARFSALVRCSLSKDPLNPVLLEKHLKALDRRLEIILHTIKDCLQIHNSKEVFFRESLD